jgi:hypothetical protein
MKVVDNALGLIGDAPMIKLSFPQGTRSSKRRPSS